MEQGDIGCVYTIAGALEESDEMYLPARLIEIEDKTEYRAFIIQGDEIEPYVEPEIGHTPLSYEFTIDQQEKLCRRYGKEFDKMSTKDLQKLLSLHLDNILVEGLQDELFR